MSATNKKKNFNYIHVALMVLMMVGGAFLPSIGSITPLGMKTLGIFFGTVYGWSTLGMVWPSLLSLTFLSTLPEAGAIATFKAGFGDRITVAIFLLLLFGELVNRVGLSKYIADWCVRRNFVQGKPFGLLIMFCLAGSFISACVNVFAAIILMVTVFYSFCKEVGLKPGDDFARYSLIAIIYISSMAGNILPFMGSSILIVGIQEQMLSLSMPYTTFALAQIVLVILTSVVYLAYVKFVVKPDVAVVEAYRPETIDMRMSAQQKFVMGLLFCMLVALFLPGLLPADLAITQLLKGLDISGIIAIVLVIYYAVNVNNKNVVPFEDLAKGVNWSLILMFATIAPLTAAVQNEQAGIMKYISFVMNNAFGEMNPMLFVILIFLIASMISQFCSNVAVMLITMPLMYTFAIQLGANPLVITILAAFNLNIAFCTPAASGQAAIVFSETKWIGRSTAFKQGIFIFVLNMLMTVVGLFLGNIIL